MKELEYSIHEKVNELNRTELIERIKKEIDYVLLGSLRPQKGHKLFECNLLTGIVNEAKYHKRKDTIGYINSIQYVETKKLIVQLDCIYIPALNLKNAIKKFNKEKNQNKYFTKPSTLNL
jgi:hypothetical protein